MRTETAKRPNLYLRTRPTRNDQPAPPKSGLTSGEIARLDPKPTVDLGSHLNSPLTRLFGIARLAPQNTSSPTSRRSTLLSGLCMGWVIDAGGMWTLGQARRRTRAWTRGRLARRRSEYGNWGIAGDVSLAVAWFRLDWKFSGNPRL